MGFQPDDKRNIDGFMTDTRQRVMWVVRLPPKPDTGGRECRMRCRLPEKAAFFRAPGVVSGLIHPPAYPVHPRAGGEHTTGHVLDHTTRTPESRTKPTEALHERPVLHRL